MRKWMPLVPALGALAFSAAVYSRLPRFGHPDLSPLVPLTISGDEPISRIAAALMLPALALTIGIALTSMSRIKRKHQPLPEWLLNEQTDANAFKRFEPTFASVTFAVTSLIVLMHVALIGSLLGWPVWTYQLLTGILGAGYIAVGNVMPRVRPNWIMGMRTRRMLSDPALWLAAHRLLGGFMVISGFLVIATSVLAPRYALLVSIVLLLASPLAAHALATSRIHSQAR
jgi:hypothetical protein